MNNKLIQWPRAKYWDKCWNPVIGCRPCSPACDHCYARAWAERFGQSFEPHGTKHVSPPRKGVVFCGNMTDLFADFVTVGESVRFIRQAAHGNGEYLWLTKRPANMCERLRWVFAKGPFCRLPGHWFGFTAEDQQRYSTRIRDFRYGMPIFVAGWLSAEPLLGPIDLGLRYIAPEGQSFEWVVVGCESGPNRRPCKLEWVESIVEECRAADVPVFVKQLDIGGKCVTDITKFPEHLRIRQVPWA